MKQVLNIKSLFIFLMFSVGLFLPSAIVFANNGCVAGYKFSFTTGKICSTVIVNDCSYGELFSHVTGKPCVDNPINILKEENKKLQQRLKVIEENLKTKTKLTPSPSKECLIVRDKFDKAVTKFVKTQQDFENKIEAETDHTEKVDLQQKRFARENRLYQDLIKKRNQVNMTCEHSSLPDLPKRTIEKEFQCTGMYCGITAEA
jgi:hypothetical protein